MGKPDKLAGLILLALTLALSGGVYSYCHPASNAEKHQCPSCKATATLGKQQPSSPSLKGEAQAETPEKVSYPVRIISTREDARHGTISFWVSNILAFFSFLAICGTVYNLILLRRQTNAISGQRDTMHDTLVAINRQASIMHQQTEHMKDSVELNFKLWMSSEKSFQAMKNKERARITVAIEGFELTPFPMVKYVVTCHGTTPAFVSIKKHVANFLPVKGYEWSRFDYMSDASEIDTVIAPGEYQKSVYMFDVPERKFTDPTTENLLKFGEWNIHFRLRLTYTDVFDDEHNVTVYKIYGLVDRGLLSGIYSPEWYDSDYKYEQKDG